jgi:hypothetical protein
VLVTSCSHLMSALI